MTVSTLAASRISDASPVGGVRHSESIAGDVRLGPSVAIAPSAIIRADAGANCVVGAGTVVQEGVAIYGLGPAKLLGDDQAPYTLWIGRGVTITHKVLIQGPAYLGDQVFIGFRSTIFNARLGANSIVMMHALVQDVEIPPGRLVPSGSVITRQSQADALPEVDAYDIALIREILGHGNPPDALTTVPNPPAPAAASPNLNERDGLVTMQSQQLSPDVVQRVRQYLAQGLRIGTEHADQRRYRSGVWRTCSPIQATREGDAFAALEACLAEHSGEYVRMFGIDPKAKQRIAPVTIQRPDGKTIEVNGAVPTVSSNATQAYRPAPASGSFSGSGSLSAEVVQQVRQFVSQGYRIGTEHADSRRYRSGVWQTCTPITSKHEGEVLAALEACLADHAGEYVRLFGIDPKANQRIAPITIQRPDGKPVAVSPASVPAGTGFGRSVGQRPAPSGGSSLSGDLAQQVRQLLSQGFHIGAEHADSRRYRSGVWQTCAPITANRENEVMAAVSQCMAAYPNEYVRIFGIDPKVKRRGPEVTVQRPGSAPAASAPAMAYSAPSAPSSSASNGSGGGQGMSQDIVQQVNQCVNQGYRLSLEAADQRRYRSNVWKTCATLDGTRVSDLLSAIEGQLRAHQGEYIRLVAVDPKAKRRVSETTIQRP